MRVIIQRVNYTEISINNNVHSSISKGLLLLLGIEETDTPNDIDWLINKILHLRIFSDENALMNLSILDVQGDIMVVSQFTLFASTKKGTRPGFTRAAKPDFAKTIYHDFLYSPFSHKYKITRSDADRLLYTIMILSGSGKFISFMFFIIVRCFGSFFYDGFKEGN